MIDVVLPTYNRASTLGRAIQSVFNQTFTDWHLWIVDDGSDDDSQLVIKHWQAKDKRISQLHSPRSQGVSTARNWAVRQSSRPWLAFIDSDDEWLEKKLAQQLKLAQKTPEAPLIHCEEIWVRRGVRVNPKKKHKKSGGWIYPQCLPLCCISPSAALMRRELFVEVGGFREDFPVCEDYDLWLKICARYPVGFVDQAQVIKYGGHEDQLSAKYHSMDFYRIVALEDILQGDLLDEENRRKTEQILLTKADLLLKGYRKHGNLSNYDRIFAYRHQVQAKIQNTKNQRPQTIRS